MAGRPVWSGAISFGMVSIPVNLQAATEEKDVHFHQLHKDCGARVRYEKVCPVHKKPLTAQEIDRGYEVQKGSYVVITDEDLESLPIPSKHTLEVTSFVHVADVDPLYYDRSYYVDPEEAGQRPLALFARALHEKEVAALGKIALRNRETLCLLRRAGDSVMLETLHWPDEIRAAVPAVKKSAEVDQKQLKMAESLIELMEGEFHPEEYRDEFREALLQKIEAKSAGHKTQDEPEAEPTKVIDLMDALRASIDAAKGSKRKSG